MVKGAHHFYCLIFVVCAGGRTEITMKRQRHKHKESFSILLISNTGRSGRQFHFSLLTFRLFLAFLFLICIALGCLSSLFLTQRRSLTALKEQLNRQEQMVLQLEEEKAALDTERQALTAENETLHQAISASVQAKEQEEALAETESRAEQDPSFPSRYPSTDTGMLLTAYSEEQPYLSLNTHTEGKVIAAGSGTITAIKSDETYPVIIEMDHGNGYQTRYMCHQEAELNIQEGAQANGGDALLTITTDNTQLDYQVLHEGSPIDPLMVLDAKG